MIEASSESQGFQLPIRQTDNKFFFSSSRMDWNKMVIKMKSLAKLKKYSLSTP